MRAELERRAPGVDVCAGTAEAIPLADAAVDGVTVAQAFHWFDPDRALREIHRVLRSDGGLALVWNARDERDPLQAALTEVIDPLSADTPRRSQRDWKTLLADSGLFVRCERTLYPHEQPLDEQGLVDRVVSISFVATAAPEVRADVEAQVRRLAREAPRPIRLSYMTEVYLGFRRELS